MIDLDHKRHRVVLSQRLVLEEELQAKKQELLDTLEVGQIREGVVVRLADFGAFVDLGGIDGLIHNSELSYARIKHPVGSREDRRRRQRRDHEVRRGSEESQSFAQARACPIRGIEHADKLVRNEQA